MNVFDIIGPDMIGPSSSHTAGAVRIGLAACVLLDGKPIKARIGLFSSFAKTGKGHGTHKAMIAGILGMKPNDRKIRRSYDIALEQGLEYEFYDIEDLDGVHPNTAVIDLFSDKGHSIKLQASSVGGGKIMVNKIDDMPVSISGENTTILILNDDRPGVMSSVTTVLASSDINIATFELNRNKKGDKAMMSIKVDDAVSAEVMSRLRNLSGVESVNILEIGTI